MSVQRTNERPIADIVEGLAKLVRGYEKDAAAAVVDTQALNEEGRAYVEQNPRAYRDWLIEALDTLRDAVQVLSSKYEGGSVLVLQTPISPEALRTLLDRSEGVTLTIHPDANRFNGLDIYTAMKLMSLETVTFDTRGKRPVGGIFAIGVDENVIAPDGFGTTIVDQVEDAFERAQRESGILDPVEFVATHGDAFDSLDASPVPSFDVRARPVDPAVGFGNVDANDAIEPTISEVQPIPQADGDSGYAIANGEPAFETTDIGDVSDFGTRDQYDPRNIERI